MSPDWILAAIAGGGVAFEALRRLRKIDRGLSRFQADWFGEDARPGVDRKPGVLERLDLIEVAQVDNRSEIADINTRLKGLGL